MLLFDSALLFFAWLAPPSEVTAMGPSDTPQVILPSATPRLPAPAPIPPASIVRSEALNRVPPVLPKIDDSIEIRFRSLFLPPAISRSVSRGCYYDRLNERWMFVPVERGWVSATPETDPQPKPQRAAVPDVMQRSLELHRRGK